MENEDKLLRQFCVLQTATQYALLDDLHHKDAIPRFEGYVLACAISLGIEWEEKSFKEIAVLVWKRLATDDF